MVPFLTPGLAPFVVAAMTKIDLPMAPIEQPPGVFVVIIAIIGGAISLGYFRHQIIDQLNVSPEFLAELARLHGLLRRGEVLLDWVGKSVLRVRVILEGRHYMGWAIFTALVGALIILFS